RSAIAARSPFQGTARRVGRADPRRDRTQRAVPVLARSRRHTAVLRCLPNHPGTVRLRLAPRVRHSRRTGGYRHPRTHTHRRPHAARGAGAGSGHRADVPHPFHRIRPAGTFGRAGHSIGRSTVSSVLNPHSHPGPPKGSACATTWQRQRMKLIIQIPCLNEEATLGIAIADLPREVPGFDRVEWLVVDDGSTDRTAAVARELGVDHVVRHPVNRGLATAFMTGLDACLRLGADVIVNTDADHQYQAADIPKLTAPILAGQADMVIGARPIDQTEHFSWIKKKLQRFGSWAVRMASKTQVADAPSGFRAMSRETAMRLNVFNAYTYTLETIIQAGLSNLRVYSVPIRMNADLRPSRLVKSISSYVRRSLVTILRVVVIYRPMRLFAAVGTLLGVIGLLVGLRFVYFYVTGDGSGRIQSVILSALCILLGAMAWMMAIISELIAVNRKLLEKLNWRIQRMEDSISGRNSPAPGRDRHDGRR